MTYLSPLHVWAIIRRLPNMQRVVVQRFRQRSQAENYLYILRRYNPDAEFVIVFDPPTETELISNVF
jgi:hypothetical protein